MILLIILFTPLLSSSNTWLQKQCIRKYIMIIIISANKFFINGIRSLVNMTMSAHVGIVKHCFWIIFLT